MKKRVVSVLVVVSMCSLLLVALKEKEPTEGLNTETVVVLKEPIKEPAEPVEEIQFYDVPLDADIQEAIIEQCGDVIDATVVIAIIEKESQYNSQEIGDGGNSKGLMQIQERWHRERMNDLECDDLLDPIQNVTVGIDYLKELATESDSIEWVLMAYNGGREYANTSTETSEYAKYVLQRAGKLKEKEDEGY